MQSPLDPTVEAEPTHIPPSICALEGPTVSTVKFIENCFIPNHVARKTETGRSHYHAILKYVLRPETVDRLLLPYKGMSRTRLKSIPEWPYLDETRLCDITPCQENHFACHELWVFTSNGQAHQECGKRYHLSREEGADIVRRQPDDRSALTADGAQSTPPIFAP
jgi:hypothetical protein